ncbi:MAG: hypothetical protein IKH02_13225 [Prevotella sp.]|nr:hypothetical protein [Prevotella sp.]MBR3089964.1 hypothetical protein [Prevotella sp.]
MKRTIFLFSLMVCFAMGLSAQNIVGKWQTDPISEEEGQKMVAELTFGADKTLQMNMSITMCDPESMNVEFHFTIDGTYSDIENNTIPFKLNGDNAVIVLDKMEFLGEMAEQLKDNQEMAEGIKKMMQQQINASKGEMTEKIPSEGAFVISEFSGDTMKLQISGEDETLTFKRLK